MTETPHLVDRQECLSYRKSDGQIRLSYLLVIGCLAGLLAGAAYADSPLSGLGYGLPGESAGARAAGMGLTSAAVADSIGLSLLNPAGWSGGPESHFGFHGVYTGSKVTDAAGSQGSDAAGFGGAALAFPLGRDLVAGMAISPLTRMDYRWKKAQSTDWTTTLTSEEGRGGLSQALIALALPVGGDTRLGVGARVAIGTINRSWTASFPDIRSDSIRGSTLEGQTRFSGVGWQISWLGKALGDLDWGAVASGPVRMQVRQQRKVTAGATVQSDSTKTLSEKFDLPSSLTLGAARRMNRHLVAVEAAWSGWGSANAPPAVGGDFADAWSLGAGWEYTPESRALDPIYRSFSYRAGAYLRDGYTLSLTGHQPRKLALTAGLSVPYAGNRSRFDLAVELGWMGSQSRDLASERTFGITLGWNHTEPWFVSRRARR